MLQLLSQKGDALLRPAVPAGSLVAQEVGKGVVRLQPDPGDAEPGLFLENGVTALQRKGITMGGGNMCPIAFKKNPGLRKILFRLGRKAEQHIQVFGNAGGVRV